MKGARGGPATACAVAPPVAAAAGSARLQPGFVALLGVAAAALALALWAPSIREDNFNRDEGAYAVVARLWAAGKLPYRDVFDHKPPVIHVMYRVVFATLGESPAAVRVVFALLSALTGVGAAFVLRAARPATARPFLVLAALATVYYQASAATAGCSANTDTPMLLFVTLAAYAALRHRSGGRRHWLAVLGLTGGLALLSKPVCGLELLLFVAVAVGTGRHASARPAASIGDLAVVAGAGVAPLLLATGYFAAHRALGPAAEAVLSYNFHYAGSSPIPFAARASFIARQVLAGFAPLLAGACLLLVRARRDDRSLAAWFFPVWTLAACLGVLAPGRPYLHYLQQLTVPLVCAAVSAVASLETARRSAPAVRARLAWIIVGLALFVPSVRATAARLREWRPPHAFEKELGRLLAGRLAATDTVLVWGAEAEIYFFADRAPASRFIYKYPLLGASRFADGARRQFLADVVAARPGAIVVVRNDGTAEDGTPSDREWETYWVPALRSLLGTYSRTVTQQCVVYFRSS
jgi:hypothetical protein